VECVRSKSRLSHAEHQAAGYNEEQQMLEIAVHRYIPLLSVTECYAAIVAERATFVNSYQQFVNILSTGGVAVQTPALIPPIRGSIFRFASVSSVQ
jgi:hypothetical protein